MGLVSGHVFLLSAWWCWWQGENRRNVCGHDKTVVLPVSAEAMAHALCCTVQAER